MWKIPTSPSTAWSTTPPRQPERHAGVATRSAGSGYFAKLYNGYNTTPIAETLTDANGHYEFTGLRPGGYYVEFSSDDTYPIQISTVRRGVIIPPGGTIVQDAFTSPRAAPRVRGVIPTIKGANVSVRWVVNLESTLPAGWTYVGFNIYRGATENGPWTKLNSEPISKIGPYEYVDTTATDLVNSYYTMTTVTTDGATTLESMFADVGQAANNLLYNADYEIDNTTTGRLGAGDVRHRQQQHARNRNGRQGRRRQVHASPAW